MKETVKRVKGGTHVTYSCSKCGVTILEIFAQDGVMRSPVNWSDFPRRCPCGEVLLVEIAVSVVVPRLIETEHIEEPGETDG